MEERVRVRQEEQYPALVRSAKLKKIDGLIAHAVYPVFVGKLEEFNNQISAAKHLAYD